MGDFNGPFRLSIYPKMGIINRRAFSNQKAIKSQSSSTEIVKQTIVTPKRKNDKWPTDEIHERLSAKKNNDSRFPSERIVLTLKIGFSLICFWMVGIFLLGCYNYVAIDLVHHSDFVKKQKVAFFTNEEMEAYRFLVYNGNLLLKNNYLNEAQSEFANALNVLQYGKEARIGMTKTLIQQCDQKNVFCSEAQAHMDYLWKQYRISLNQELK